ncbi:MAG TPA: AMP-binding protein, partial [Terriglobia bacterium]|nr:AMP-binding protein [Terriglobia bacterium]
MISLHALCADSWTLRNLFREVSRFYAAELEGQELPEEAVQYLQFSEWQHELLEELNEEIEGREQEADHPDPDLILPLEFDPAGASEFQHHHFAPEFVTLRFDWPMARRIEAVSNACHSPVSSFLLACWQILLWRLSAKEEILTEYLFDGRPFEKLHDALGLFAGYVPVRGTFGHHPRFDEAVERALKSLDQAFELREFSLREMASGRARNRVQAIGFEYEEWPEPQSAGSAKFTYWRQRYCIGRFKLKLGIYRTANGLTVELQYDSALFSRESVGLIGERYLRLVESAASDRKALIRDLQIIGRRELETLLDDWNKTEQRLTVLRPIHDLIGEQARLRPESIAVIYRDEQLCYLELEIRANRLAHHLRAQGVGPDCVVGLYLARSTEMMVGLLGILKAGGAYLPLEIGLPAERLGTMLEDSGARLVITKQDMARSLPPGRYRTVLLDGESERLAEYSQAAPELELSLENLAYVIYTSGSTGKPKGVMVRHGSVVNLLEGLEGAIYEGESEDLTVSVNASLSFDSSVKQLIQLGRGRRLCIVPEAER